MTSLLRLRDQGLVEPFVGAALQSGAYDLSGRSPSGRLFADEFLHRGLRGSYRRPDQRRRLPPTATSVACRRSRSSWAPWTSCSRTTWRWRPCCHRQAAKWTFGPTPESPHGFTSFPTAMAPPSEVSNRGLLTDCSGSSPPQSDR